MHGLCDLSTLALTVAVGDTGILSEQQGLDGTRFSDSENEKALEGEPGHMASSLRRTFWLLHLGGP